MPQVIVAMTAVAESGDTKVQYVLGVMYLLGEGVGQDKDKGFKLIKSAADQGFTAAESFLAENCILPNELVDLNYELGFNYAKSAAEKGDVASKQVLGAAYFQGLGVEVDYAKAFYWLNQHYLDTGDLTSKLLLGRMYVQALGVEKNDKIALELLSDVYKQGVTEAAGDLGYLYLYGYGIERDFTKARELFEFCVESGIEQAGVNLGVIYEMGLGVERDVDTARMWYNRAAAGSVDAKKMLDELQPGIVE